MSVRRASGELTGYAEWITREGADPVELLDDSERVALEQLLTETT